MTPESLSSFERMLASFAYNPGTAVAAAAGDTVVGRRGEKQKKTEEEATRKRDKTSPAPAPPQTPPRPLYMGRRPSAVPQPDGTVAESAVTMPRETVAHEAVATTSATAEGEGLRRRRRLIPLAGSSTGVVLPPCKGKPQNSWSDVRKDVDGSPAIVSPFFHHQPSASTGRDAKYEQIELTEEGKDEYHVDVTNSSNRKMRMKRSHGGTSRRLKENRAEEHEGRKPKRKKIVVVSPYFATSSRQRVRELGAEGVGEEVEVVVQRRAKKKKTIPVTESTAEGPASCSCGHDHSSRVEGKKKRKPKHPTVQLTAAERTYDAYKRVPHDNRWVPPFSDHELLQEIHFFDHWRVLVICMLLNRTTGRKVRRILPRLFLLCSDAETTTKVSEEDIEELIRPLGLQKKRSKMIKRMSEEYLGKEWTHVTQLHGIGKYAADAYAIFCSGAWKEVKPDDHKLVDYWRFLLSDKYGRESITVQRSTGAD